MCRYNTFCGYPPEIVKKMPKKDLTEEVIYPHCLYLFVKSFDLYMYIAVVLLLPCQNYVILISVLFSSSNIRYGDFKQLLVNRQKSQNTVSKSMKDFKM